MSIKTLRQLHFSVQKGRTLNEALNENVLLSALEPSNDFCLLMSGFSFRDEVNWIN
jgi:hypothetical protein